MKKVEKKIEIIEYRTQWEAIDGEVFLNEIECAKYEDPLRCIARSKVQKLIVATAPDAWELMGGNDDTEVVAFKVASVKDVDTIKQFFLAECPWYKEDSRAEYREKKFAIMDEAQKNKDLLLFGKSEGGDYYFINSRQNIINNLMNLGVKEEEKK